MVAPQKRPKVRDDHRAGPVEEEQPLAEDLPATAAAAGNDIFKEVELFHPHIRAKIQKFSAFNEGMSESSSMGMVTESAPCGDAPSKQGYNVSHVNPRHWN